MGRCCGEYFPHWNRERELHPPTTWGRSQTPTHIFPACSCIPASRCEPCKDSHHQEREKPRSVPPSSVFPLCHLTISGRQICRPWGENRTLTCTCTPQRVPPCNWTISPLDAAYGIRGRLRHPWSFPSSAEGETRTHDTMFRL